ncbi:MarR family winged helix-turn-helix transcriptional regulator [Cellulomonas soli]|uniref:MarR family winged helix-turn-helix transcriptional regulator n=1 Tax=Cellulomonas soli TaxID=931535 RepID=UPI003F87FF8B
MSRPHPAPPTLGVHGATVADDLRRVEFESMLLGRHLEPILRHTTGEERLERSAYTLLTRLELDGPLSIGQLSDAFGLDVSTLNRQTAAVLRAGLVDRIPDPDGGMARKFCLTPEGRRRLEFERESNTQGLAGVLADWDEADLATLAQMLHRFNVSIEVRRRRAWPRP